MQDKSDDHCERRSHENKAPAVQESEETLARNGEAPKTNEFESLAACPKSPMKDLAVEDDGSLMHLYESRLRRLRDYDAAVNSRFENPISSDFRSRLDSPLWREGSAPVPSGGRLLQQYSSQLKAEANPSLCVRTSGKRLPLEIQLQGDDDQDILDDITLSTDIKSSSDANTIAKETVTSAPEVSNVDSFEPQSVNGETNEDFEAGLLAGSWADATEGSTNSSSASKASQDFPDGENVKRETSETEWNDGYTYAASTDSKFEAYSVMVDPEQDDRAVEIALYSTARPHMRGFHFAWLSFFVAFFTWFALTPLLSEVAASLSLSREQIWTSSVLAVAGSALTRVFIGPINDIHGARWTMSCTLAFIAIPTAIAGAAIQNAASLYVIRLLIGVAGSSFVTCQFWTTSMFVPEVAGTANSLAAGWGNLGGGVAQVVMGSLLFPLFKVIYGGEGYGNSRNAYSSHGEETEYDRASDLAWRTILVFPACMCLYMAYAIIRYSDDCPKGNFRKRKLLGLMTRESAKDAFRRGGSNWNTWWLFVQYGCCFGVEITMTNAAALYFQEEFAQTTESAAAIASVFGWMNLFARGIGGFLSDMTGASYGMRGRLWTQVLLLLAEGALVCVFSTTRTLVSAIVVMVMFSIFVQAAEGSTFSVVPYVDYAVTGSIAGFVGAGGNVGGVLFSLLFRDLDNRTAFLVMGCIVMASSMFTVLISIPGHRGLLRGEDAQDVIARRCTHNEQRGSRPNVEIHIHNGDGHQIRQTVLREETPTLQAMSTLRNETEDPSTVSAE